MNLKINIPDNIHLKRHQEHLKAKQTHEEEKENLITATFGDADRQFEVEKEETKLKITELQSVNKFEENGTKMIKKSKLQDILEKKLRKQSIVETTKPKEQDLPTEADVEVKESVPEQECSKLKESNNAFKIKSLRQEDMPDVFASAKNQQPEVDRMKAELNNLKESTSAVLSPRLPLIKLNGFLHPSCIYLPNVNEIIDKATFINSRLPPFKTLELVITKDTKSFFGSFFPVFHVSFMVEL